MGAGNDSLWGGKGNDTIVDNGTKNIYKYANDDGKDVIYNLGSTDTVVISGNTYTKKISGNDVILTVGKGKITLKNAKGKTLNINGTLKGGKSTLSIPTDAYTYKGHSYYIFNNKSTWETAQAYCESRGGHLAVINNAKENSKLFKYMKSKGYDSVYFGLSDMGEEGKWTWANGDKVSYTNWASGEPNGGTSTVTVPSGDVLKGTNGHDNLYNSSSNKGKIIYAYDGNDTVTNYANNVYISGGAGNDYINSYGDNSTIHGDAGADNITVKSNNALICGDDGNDKIITYNEGNFIYGGNLTLAISGGGSVILENVSSGQSININDTTYKISGKTLK